METATRGTGNVGDHSGSVTRRTTVENETSDNGAHTGQRTATEIDMKSEKILCQRME